MTDMTNENANETYLALIKKMRDPDVTASNAATPWTRETFRRLLETTMGSDGVTAHTFTIADVTIAVCSVYLPVTEKGKRADTIGALGRKGTPGVAMAGRINAVKAIMAEIGKPSVRALVDAFIASTGTAQRDSFGALVQAVKEAVKEAAPKAVEPVPSEGEGEGEGTSANAPLSALDKVKAMTSLIAALSDSELLELATTDDLADLSAAIVKAYERGAALFAEQEIALAA